MKQMLVEYARYNLWANQLLISLFRSVDDALISQTVVSSFPSIRNTFLHILDAETVWIERLNGRSLKEFPSINFVGTNEEIFKKVLETSTDFLHFVENMPAPLLRDKVTFTTFAGDVMTEPIRVMIHHCMNHSTFHRGQLVMMCRQLGISPIPKTDFIYFSRENDKMTIDK
jgi:uncharacterized damage-inducible protein DinB